jgi:hypothetical protein
MVFETIVVSEGLLGGMNKVNCAAPFSEQALYSRSTSN